MDANEVHDSAILWLKKKKSSKGDSEPLETPRVVWIQIKTCIQQLSKRSKVTNRSLCSTECAEMKKRTTLLVQGSYGKRGKKVWLIKNNIKMEFNTKYIYDHFNYEIDQPNL